MYILVVVRGLEVANKQSIKHICFSKQKWNPFVYAMV